MDPMLVCQTFIHIRNLRFLQHIIRKPRSILPKHIDHIQTKFIQRYGGIRYGLKTIEIGSKKKNVAFFKIKEAYTSTQTGNQLANSVERASSYLLRRAGG